MPYRMRSRSSMPRRTSSIGPTGRCCSISSSFTGTPPRRRLHHEAFHRRGKSLSPPPRSRCRTGTCRRCAGATRSIAGCTSISPGCQVSVISAAYRAITSPYAAIRCRVKRGRSQAPLPHMERLLARQQALAQQLPSARASQPRAGYAARSRRSVRESAPGD